MKKGATAGRDKPITPAKKHPIVVTEDDGIDDDYEVVKVQYSPSSSLTWTQWFMSFFRPLPIQTGITKNDDLSQDLLSQKLHELQAERFDIVPKGYKLNQDAKPYKGLKQIKEDHPNFEKELLKGWEIVNTLKDEEKVQEAERIAKAAKARRGVR